MNQHNIHSHASRLAHWASNHLDSITIQGLTPQAKANIEKYISEHRNNEVHKGAWGFLTSLAIIGTAILLLICLACCIYKRCKNRSATEQVYQDNFPVMANGQIVNRGPATAARNPRGRDANFAESVTWQLETNGKVR